MGAVDADAPAAPVVPAPSVVRLFSGVFVPLQATTPTVNATTYTNFFTFYPPSLQFSTSTVLPCDTNCTATDKTGSRPQKPRVS
jgi:hypothetical protein